MPWEHPPGRCASLSLLTVVCPLPPPRQLKVDEGIRLNGDDNDLSLFLSSLVHAADLGSTAKPAETYFNWAQVMMPPPSLWASSLLL